MTTASDKLQLVTGSIVAVGCATAALLVDALGLHWLFSGLLWLGTTISSVLAILAWQRTRLESAQKGQPEVTHPATHASSDDWLASALHELKGPLSRMRISLAQAGFCCNPPTEALDKINTEITRIERIIAMFTELMRLEQDRQPQQLEPTDIGELLLEITQRYSVDAEAGGIELIRELAGDIKPLESNPELLVQCLDQLVANALAYAGQGARITLHAANAPKGGVILKICDTGPGIAADERAKLLQPFVRGESAREHGVAGSGLGLAFVARAVMFLGGELELSDSDPHGLCVSIHLD